MSQLYTHIYWCIKHINTYMLMAELTSQFRFLWFSFCLIYAVFVKFLPINFLMLLLIFTNKLSYFRIKAIWTWVIGSKFLVNNNGYFMNDYTNMFFHIMSWRWYWVNFVFLYCLFNDESRLCINYEISWKKLSVCAGMNEDRKEARKLLC